MIFEQLLFQAKEGDLELSLIHISQDSQEDGEEHFTVVFSHESKELPNRSRFFRLHNRCV